MTPAQAARINREELVEAIAQLLIADRRQDEAPMPVVKSETVFKRGETKWLSS